MINPAEMMKAAGMFRRFQKDHPKVVSFFQQELSRGVPEGTVIEITIRKPGENPVTVNMKVLAADVEMFEEMKKMQS